MTSRDGNWPYGAIDAKLASVVESFPTRTSWFERWENLGPDSPELEHLAVYQAIRDSGVLPADAGFCIVSWQIDAIARQAAEPALRYLGDRLAAIEKEHGLEEDEAWESVESNLAR